MKRMSDKKVESIIQQAEQQFEELLQGIKAFVNRSAKTPGTAAHRQVEGKRTLDKSLPDLKKRRRRQTDMKHERALSALDESPELATARTAIGAEKWNELSAFFLRLPNEYQTLGGRITEAHKHQMKVVKLCCELSDLLDRHRPEQYHDILGSEFEGLIAKHVLTPDWVDALEGLRHVYAAPVAAETLKRAFLGLYLTDPSELLKQMLKRYAETIEKEPFSRYYRILFRFGVGKINQKEFVKRAVFAFLRAYWPKRRSPNKETAMIVNAVLGLHGKQAVTANDITQMNKKSRRKYYREK